METAAGLPAEHAGSRSGGPGLSGGSSQASGARRAGASPRRGAGAGPAGRSFRRAMNAEDKDRRRSEILKAAKRTFSAKGYHATTISDIAKAARLSYGSVYWYFDSKDALFHALMEAEGSALRAHIQAALSSSIAAASADAPFREAVRATFEFFERDRASARLLFRDSYALGDRFEKHLFGIYEGFIGDIEVLVDAAVSAGLINDFPPRMVAFSVAALIGQIAQRRIVTDDGLDAGVVADFVVSLLLNGLLPRSDRGGGTHPQTPTSTSARR